MTIRCRLPIRGSSVPPTRHPAQAQSKDRYGLSVLSKLSSVRATRRPVIDGRRETVVAQLKDSPSRQASAGGDSLPWAGVPMWTTVVPLAGIEPTTFPLGEGRSILLSYRGGCATAPGGAQAVPAYSLPNSVTASSAAAAPRSNRPRSSTRTAPTGRW
jgi:hypothetical protein